MSEAMGKILGMAMAYGVSSLGLLLAYVNYRRRVVEAEKVMSAQAWVVMAVSLLAVAAGAGIVASLAARAEAPGGAAAQVPPKLEPQKRSERQRPPVVAAPSPPSATPRARWPWIGILVPAGIFLLATWITTALHRRFSVGHRGSD